MKEIENDKFDLFVSNYIKNIGSCFDKDTNILIYKLAKHGFAEIGYFYAGMEGAQVMLFT